MRGRGSLMVSAALACACAGGDRGRQSSGPGVPAVVTSDAAVDATAVDAAPPFDAPPPIGEAYAREILAERFRAAGFRIRYDVPLREDGLGVELTCDGFDPSEMIGFEYVDPSEVGTDLTADEKARLSGIEAPRILVVGPTDAEGVKRAADAFIAGVTAEID